MKLLKCFLLLCVVMMTLPVSADSTQTLTVNGQKVEKVVAQITFDGDQVVLHFTDEGQQSADMDAVTLAFTLDDTSAIGTIRESVTDLLSIEGLPAHADVLVFDATGKRVLSTKASNARALLSTTHLKSGIYLLKAGNQVVKFIKK